MIESVEAAAPSTSTPRLGYLIFLCGAATLAGFLFGMDCSVINGAVSAISAAFRSSAAVTGFAVAAVLMGSAIGAFYAGQMADRFGRKTVMIATGLIFLITSWGTGAATAASIFTSWRLLGGLAIGAASVVAPAYIAEISPPALRGRLAILQQLAIVTGVLLAFISNYLIARWAGGAEHRWLLGLPAWRWMFWALLPPSGVYILALFFLPESPRYLVAQRKETKARQVMLRLWGDAGIDESLVQIRETVNRERPPRLGDLMVAGKRRLLPIVWVGIGVAFFQQSVGINPIVYYGALLWQTAGFSEANALLINLPIGFVLLLSGIIAMALIDRIGRRRLLLGGSAVMAALLFVVTFAFASGRIGPSGQLVLTVTQATTALVAVHLVIFFFGVSWGPVAWVMLGEMFPNRIRGAALAVAGAVLWMSNFTITMTFPILLASIGLVFTYGLYAVLGAASFIFAWLWVPETKGRTLESDVSPHRHGGLDYFREGAALISGARASRNP